MSARQILTFVAGGLLGAGGMWLALGSTPPPAARPLAPVVSAPARQQAPSTDVEAIRTAVRQELRAAEASRPPAVPAPQPVAAAPAPKNEEPAHPDEAEAKPPSPRYGEAQRMVEVGLSRRTWSSEDRGQLQLLMPMLSPAERETLAKQLIVAANRGELKVDVAGPLF
ncbi:hypothetical protein [Archangium sp.]|uniref:hypothetical protein n=1 Tax=Archangium sp. TaxID=1872627 RepID=UPI003899EB23